MTPTTLPEKGAATSSPTPLALARMFVGVALAGIGGGLPAHTRRALTGRGWMTDEAFAETFTLAQLTPGPNAVNLAAMVGARLSGRAGAAASTLGVLTPGLLAMLAVSVVTLGRPGGLPPALQSGLRGAACAALAVLLTAALPVVRVGWSVRGGPVITVLAFLALGVLRLDLLPVLLVLLGAGLLLHRPTRTARGEAP
ncbi:chromate transporter [Deinococcus phoenicis]|uniref:Chromate transporter n=1 Tax=Deinococcus phoenicis TaxID=1476583 RepID=A0A016QQU4_9DEIO|nr:chromate transporter [Deinococcus phoenicis]EYB68257.1 chromate transporter [Deinococcus phoenicis]